MQKILLVSPVECYPSLSGNSSRIRTFYEKLVSIGFDVYYLHLPERSFNPEVMQEKIGDKYFYRPYKYLTFSRIKLVLKALRSIVLNKKVRKIRIDDLMSESDIPYFKKILSKINPDIVLINYAYYSKFFEYTPKGILKILDTHDSMYLRFNKIYNFKKGFKNLNVSIKDEIQCLNRADKIICIQNAEADFFRENGCLKQIVTIGHNLQFEPTSLHEHRNQIGYIATDYHVNIEAIQYFIEHLWPHIQSHNNNELTLVIAGKVCNMLPDFDPSSKISKIGIVSRLKDFYDQVDIAINPVLAGSGLKIKCVEPLSFGKPIITTDIGAEGLEEFIGKGLFICSMHSPEDWAVKLRELCSDDFLFNAVLSDTKNVLLEYNKKNTDNLYSLF